MTETNPPEQLASGQQLLFRTLAEKDRHGLLAGLYLGALAVLGQRGNPDRHALAAHGLRELMEKLPHYLDLPIDATTGTGSESHVTERARKLAKPWKAFKESSSWDRDGGVIDHREELGAFLKEADTFFEWLKAARSPKRAQARNMFRGLDLSGQKLPEPIEKLRLDQWMECRGFFLGIAHHNCSTDDSEFNKWLAFFESYLLERFHPRSFETQEALDRIIGKHE